MRAEEKRPTTIRWYMGKLKIFLRYLQAQDLPTDATELTTAHLRAFLVHLREYWHKMGQNSGKLEGDTPQPSRG